MRKHQSSRQEIQNLLQIVSRDISDAQGPLSADWRFGIAYNAALKLCTILLHGSGYRPEKTLHHYRTIHSLPLILGESVQGDCEYLDVCRVKRNQAEYDRAGVVSENEADELIRFVEDFRMTVLEWLKTEHPEWL
ncbi:MAG: hypothetical protein KAT93_04535 [Desulfuromonadales bacterium]|nr:hypothetical protein [Desulfuromonadales bacterium]